MNVRLKIKELITSWVPGGVYSAQWLKNQGYSYSNIQDYKRSGWIQSLGSGAYVRSGDDLNWQSGVWGLQTQMRLPIHVGGKTAIEEAGYAQYLNLGTEKVHLFADPNTKLPQWFKKTNWKVEIDYTQTSLFGEFSHSNKKLEQSLRVISFSKLGIIYSVPERAFLEYLDWVPDKHSFTEAKEIMENLISLRPNILQNLLENCKSVKVKRLFFAIAETINHPWFSKLKIDKIDLGSGNRHLIKGGEFNSKYKITVKSPNE